MAYSGATASTARTAMANARGTSFSAVSAPHASRNDAPRTARPLTATVTSVERACSDVLQTTSHGTVVATATPMAPRDCLLIHLSHALEGHYNNGRCRRAALTPVSPVPSAPAT